MNYTIFCNGAFHSAGSFVPDSEERENQLINLYPQFTDQTWDAFGGAITDSAAYVFSLMSKRQQEELLDAYFGVDGLRYTLLRVPIDSCDFSLEQYEASPDGKPEHFDMSRPLKYILPMLEAIRARADVTLMLSPWSPPVEFKTVDRRHGGGKCRPEYYGAWAEYICQYIREFTERGFRVSRISLQNEPHAIQTWDSCLWTAEEEREFLVEHMKPALLRHGYGDIQIYIWDHNKERILERALSTFDGAGRDAADGVAFHWYSGDHFELLRQVHQVFPEKKLMLSENCLEYSKHSVADPVAVRSMLAHEIFGDLESGMSAYVDWNVLLDSHGGPNYAGNFAHAPFLFDIETMTLQKQSIYDAFWHFAHFITPGSVRILSSSFSERIETTAFRRPDGAIALVLQNCGADQALYIRLEEQLAALRLPEKTLATILIT